MTNFMMPTALSGEARLQELRNVLKNIPDEFYFINVYELTNTSIYASGRYTNTAAMRRDLKKLVQKGELCTHGRTRGVKYVKVSKQLMF